MRLRLKETKVVVGLNSVILVWHQMSSLLLGPDENDGESGYQRKYS